MEDIAIVGMACLFPGAPDIRTFWQNIADKKSAITDPPQGWGGEFSFDPESVESDRIYCVKGGYLGDISRFDPVKYGVMPNAVDGAEPEHFLALKAAHDALKDAGFPDVPLNKDRTEVILGRGTYVNRALMNLHQHGFVIHQTLRLLKELHPEYTDGDLGELKAVLKKKLPPFDAYTAPGVVSSIMSGRIANRLDLKGANYTIDAACASSLLAVEHAVDDLRSGKCDAAIAGGVQLSANNLVLMVFSQLGALSRSNHIQPFDADCDGTMLGEGVGMVVLKRVSDAERDGNRIYALVKGVGSSSDGRAKSVVAPRLEGEELAIRRAYGTTDVPADTVGLIEAHGTGIPLGDVTEIEALKKVFGARRAGAAGCAIGTVKSMIGHLIPASGIAAVIKTALALYHRALPPTICERPNPALGLDNSRFYINTHMRPWISGVAAPRRAGVNAFGFGGINSHAILEEYAANDKHAFESYQARWDSELFILSGETREALLGMCARVRAFLEETEEADMKDLAYTVNRGIKGKKYRLSIVAQSAADLSGKLAHAVMRLNDTGCARIKDRSGIYFFEEPLALRGRLAFLFPGEGSQYVNMLSDLCLHFPEVRRCFDLVDGVFIKEIGYPLSARIYPPPGLNEAGIDADGIWQMETGVQAVTAANRALFQMLTRLGIAPDAVAGHSSGEFGALEAAGAIELGGDEGVAGYVLGGIRSVKGVAAAAEAVENVMLLAIGAQDRSIIEKVIDGSGGALKITMDNCPYQTIICGREASIKTAMETLRSSGAIFNPLPFNRAYHTSGFEAACGALKSFFGSLRIRAPRIPVYSCAYVSAFPDTPEGVRKFSVDQWMMPVRFRETVEKMYEDGIRIFLEAGPGSNLTSFVNDTLRGKDFAAAAVSVRHSSGISSLHHALGMLCSNGVDMDLAYLYSRRAPRRLDMEGGAADKGAVKDRKEPKLSLTLPMLHLDGDDLKGLRASGAVGKTPVRMEERALCTPPDSSNTRGDEAMPFPRPLEKAPTDASGKNAAPRAELMAGYLRTQEAYLEVQQNVMTAYLRRRNRSGNAAPAPGSGRKRRGMPFIGAVTSLKQGEEITVRRRLDLNEDLFLGHHVLGGRVSMTDEDLHALAVMPMTMSMEMMAEAAAELVPGRVLTGMRKVRAYRWIAVDGPASELEMTARLVSRDEVHVVMRGVDAEKTAGYNPLKQAVRAMNVNSSGYPGAGSGVVHSPLIEGIMVFSDRYPEPPATSAPALKDGRPSRFTEDNMYTTGMFNGPCFQAVASIDRWGAGGAIATLKAMPTDRLFRADPAPDFVIDPIMLDAAGQVAAHWNAEASSKGFNFFPYLMEELRIYGPNLTPGQRAGCRLRISALSKSVFRSDIDITGPDGGMLMEIKGWEDKSFDLPEIFHMIRHGRPDAPLSERWDALVPLFGEGEDYECRRVVGFPDDLLMGHGKIWLNALAHQILSRDERAAWRNLNAADKKRIEWLLGRGAAKDAVRALLKRLYGLDLCPADIEIGADAYGRPFASGGWVDKVESVPVVSITHTGGIVAAIAADGRGYAGVGIDVEPVRRLEDGFGEVAFHESERYLLNGLSHERKDEWTLRLWCAKEAASKAAGTGLRGNPKGVAARAVDLATGWAEFELSGEAAGKRPGLKGIRLSTHTFVEDNIIAGVSVRVRRVEDAKVKQGRYP